MARHRERDRGRERERPREEDEEAVAGGVRRRVERAIEAGDEGDLNPRVSYAPWRLTTMGLPFLILLLGTASRVGSCIDTLHYGGDLKEYVPPITDAQKEAMGEVEKAADKLGQKLVFDPRTSNLLRGVAAENIDKPPLNEPLVTFVLNGETFVARRSCAMGLLKADKRMRKELGHGIEVSSSFRSNQYQAGARKRSYGTGVTGAARRLFDWQKTAAAGPGGSFHEAGCAFDIKNWEEAQPYLETEGFIGGFENGILPPDPVHFDQGRIAQPVGEERAKKVKKAYCKRHGKDPICE